MRGHREDKRRERLIAQHRCVTCCDKLPFDSIANTQYCPKCKAAVEAEVWRRSCDGDAIKTISADMRRPRRWCMRS